MEIRTGWIEILYIAFEKTAIYEVCKNLDRLQLFILKTFEAQLLFTGR